MKITSFRNCFEI